MHKSFAVFKLNSIKQSQLNLSAEIKIAEKIKIGKLAELNELFAKTAALRIKYEKMV